MPTKILNQVFETAGELGKKAADEVKKEVSTTGKQFEAQLLYGTTTLTDEDVKKGFEKDSVKKTQDIQAIERELSMHANGENPQLNQNVEANQNPAMGTKDLAQEQQSKQQLAQEHHRRQVEDVLEGRPGPRSEEQERQQKKQLEEEEDKEKKLEDKQNLDNPIEAPAGKSTGLKMKRKNNTPKMKPPKTGENKVGQGGRE